MKFTFNGTLYPLKGQYVHPEIVAQLKELEFVFTPEHGAILDRLILNVMEQTNVETDSNGNTFELTY